MACAAPRIRPALQASLLAIAAAVLAAPPAAAQYGPVDPFESSLRALRELVGSPNDGMQVAAMGALRDLDDPALQPLFDGYLKGDDWTLRVASLLGLAELSSDRRVDVGLLESLPGEGDRAAALNAAISLGLLDVPRIERILTWDDLSAAQRVLLACELRKNGATPDAAMLSKLAASKSPEVAALAAALLLDQGRDLKPDQAGATAQAAAEAARTALAALPAASLSNAVPQIAEACSTRRLAGAAPFIASLCSLDGLSNDARLRTLGSLLVLSPEAAYPAFAASVERNREQPALVRHAAILLASGVRAPSTEWDRVRNGDPLLETIADAGTLLGKGEDKEAYAKLAGLRHRITMVASVEGAQRLEASAQRELGALCLSMLLAERRKLGPLSEATMRGVALLARNAPEELRPALESVRDDRELVEALLRVLSAAGSREAAMVAESAAGHSSRLGDTLVAVMRARSGLELSAGQLQLLATAAGGGVDVDPTVRAQAAWLWLERSGKATDAVKALTAAKEPTP
ncbi:MAG: hypothetical protein ACKOYN_09110 [Planctomycetota bacterium]